MSYWHEIIILPRLLCIFWRWKRICYWTSWITVSCLSQWNPPEKEVELIKLKISPKYHLYRINWSQYQLQDSADSIGEEYIHHVWNWNHIMIIAVYQFFRGIQIFNLQDAYLNPVILLLLIELMHTLYQFFIVNLGYKMFIWTSQLHGHDGHREVNGG